MLKSKNKYLRFIANGFLFLVIIFLIDQLIGKTLQHYYFKSTSGDYYRTTYAMDSTQAEVIILGSSRASHHYIPEIFEDSLGMSCYNTGRDGNFLLFSYAVFKSIVKRYSPKIILLDINAEDLYYSPKSYDGLASLLPYYADKPELQNIIKLKSKVEELKLYSKMYPFNSTIIAISKGNLASYNDTKYKGYLPLYGSSVNQNKPNMQLENTSEFDANKLNAIDSMASICRQKQIKFIVVQSPRYTITNGKEVSLELNRILSKNKGMYWDYVNDTVFMQNQHFFKDGAHLNHDGATVFTGIVVDRIERDLNYIVSNKLNPISNNLQ